MGKFEEIECADGRVLRRVDISSVDWEFYDYEDGPPYSTSLGYLPGDTPIYRLLNEDEMAEWRERQEAEAEKRIKEKFYGSLDGAPEVWRPEQEVRDDRD